MMEHGSILRARTAEEHPRTASAFTYGASFRDRSKSPMTRTAAEDVAEAGIEMRNVIETGAQGYF
jgi:hypothetical protein